MGEHDDDFMEQAFLVELGADEFVDLDSLPSCGMEYLKRVMFVLNAFSLFTVYIFVRGSVSFTFK